MWDEKEIISPTMDSNHIEQNILGCLILKSDLIEYMEGIFADHFYEPRHQIIYRTIQLLTQGACDCDVLILSEALKNNNELNAAGGEVYLFDLGRLVATTANFRAYIPLLQEKYEQRKLIKIGQELVSNAKDDPENAIQIIRQQLDSFITSAASEIVFRKDSLTLIVEELQNRANGELKGLPTGFMDLDTLTHGFQQSDLIVLAARPSIGKTTLALNIADYVTLTGGKTVLFFSLEMNKLQIVERSISNIASILSTNLQTGQLTPEEMTRLSKYLETTQKDKLIIDDRSALYVQDMRSLTRKVQKEHGLSLVIIDHLGFIQGVGENETLKLGNITRELKSMARDLGIPVLVLCQLNRGVEQRNNKRPSLSDLRQSGRIEEDADLVLMLYRDEYYEPTTAYKGVGELIISKHRNGAVGTLYLTFQGQYCRFLNFTGQLPQVSLPREKKRDYFDYN